MNDVSNAKEERTKPCDGKAVPSSKLTKILNLADSTGLYDLACWGLLTPLWGDDA